MHFAESLRILVVEDEALIMMAALDMLGELGHAPLSARSAEAALVLFDRDTPVDVMVTDVNLPDMDGVALAVEARKRRPGLPIVFATGYRLNVAPEVSAGGPTTVLSKPYLTKELAEALHRISAPSSELG